MITLYALALLYAHNKLLLVRRKHPTFGNGMYSFIGGKTENNESALQALVREVYEETGIILQASDFSFAHVLDRKGTEGPFIALCFQANVTGIQPTNKEPDKHDDMQFFALDNIPDTLLPAHKQILDCIAQNITYSEHGW